MQVCHSNSHQATTHFLGSCGLRNRNKALRVRPLCGTVQALL